MKYTFAAFTFLFLFVSCGQTQNKPLNIPTAEKQKPGIKEAVAYFAEGCFWHSEIVFQSLGGVRDAVSGYAGGNAAHPTYESVSTGETGHTETVKVFYDPQKISYATLVNAFFASQDPTELNRQGPDEGTQYRSVAFYTNDNEKQIIEAAIKQLTASKKYNSKIVTEVRPLIKFYSAEEYHQEYIYNHPDNPYVRSVSIPDFMRFKKIFQGKLKS